MVGGEVEGDSRVDFSDKGPNESTGDGMVHAEVVARDLVEVMVVFMVLAL